MPQNLNAILLVLSLYFSVSQPVFADESITAATPQNKQMIEDYLQMHPIDEGRITALKQQAAGQVAQLPGLSPQDIKQLVEQSAPKQLILPKLDPGKKAIEANYKTQDKLK
jgi:hypothetical protein